MIPVYQPQIQVWLHKTVQRKTTNGKDAVSQRFSGRARDQRIDLRPFLGQGAGVQTTKSVSAPAGGFSLTLVDRPDGDAGSFESLYGLIEPMDMIEIRARHGAASIGDTEPPIIMRGFVSQVSRSESADGEGRPQRRVMVSGQDYGKIWQIIQINYHAGYLVGQALITGFGLFEQYGIEAKTVQGSEEFVSSVANKIINPFLDGLLPQNSPMPRALKLDLAVKTGTVSPQVQTQQGTIYELLRYFGDVGPWNELYVEDRSDGVYLVYRPNPYRDITSGELIQKDAAKPTVIPVYDEDVMALNVSRSDADIANFYWVQSARFNLVNSAYQKQEASASGDKTVVLSEYPNSDSKLYGLRLMTLETQQGATSSTSHGTGGAAEQVQKGQQTEVEWMAERRRIVSESNRDNVLFERGSIRIRGNEAIKAGNYIRLRRGTFSAEYYVASVSHEYMTMEGFYSTLEVERGTGFADRIRASGSPYFAELTR